MANITAEAAALAGEDPASEAGVIIMEEEDSEVLEVALAVLEVALAVLEVALEVLEVALAAADMVAGSEAQVEISVAVLVAEEEGLVGDR